MTENDYDYVDNGYYGNFEPDLQTTAQRFIHLNELRRKILVNKAEMPNETIELSPKKNSDSNDDLNKRDSLSNSKNNEKRSFKLKKIKTQLRFWCFTVTVA